MSRSLHLLPPEVVAGRKRKRIERAFILVGIVLVLAMVGLGVQRFLKVHTAENQVANLQGQIAGLKTQIPKFNKVQQERSAILGLAAISSPIVNTEVYWPGVFTALAKSTPSGGTVTSFSGSAVPVTTPDPVPAGTTPPPPLPPQDVETASVMIQVLSSTGYPYFSRWYYEVNGSGNLSVDQYSGLTQSTPKHVDFGATLWVTEELRSPRANEFKVPG